MLFASSSCEKLVEVPIDKIDSEYISTTEGGLKAAVVGLYNLHRSNYFPSGTETGAQNNNFFYVATDLGHVRAVLDWVYTTERFHAQEGALSYIWPNYYKTIERCNVVIASAANINMDQTKKDVLIAEARAIRAELYLDLLTMYDNIVLKTEPSKAEDIGKVSYKSADSKDVYKVIDNDLDFAIAKLPWTVESGRLGWS